MDSFLQILGSIASIGSIPLAIFIYIRSREVKFYRIKQEIVKILSYQIGEGRSLSVFEISAVISSKVRENSIKNNAIEVYDIIEDLVSETIASPMLESERKKEIISNLESLHTKDKLSIIQTKPILGKIDTSENPNNQKTNRNFGDNINISDTHSISMKENISKFNYTSKLSERFAVIASVMTIIALIITVFGEKVILVSLSTFFNENLEIVKISLSLIVGLIAAFATFFFNNYLWKKSKREKK
ncbi:MAG: hypothetical protein Q8K60_09035 [Parachlamydiaceae bacterium]|nr:hypothetical protein [Parachlamydiaceae bacterium]